MGKRLFFCLLISLMVATSSLGCASSAKAPMEIVPQDANFIASAQVDKLLSDQDLIKAYNDSQKSADEPQTVDEALNKLTQETGIDLRQFTMVTMFGDATTLDEPSYFCLIAEGNFNESQFINDVQIKTGEQFTTSDYKGYKLYSGGEKKFAIAFLSNKMLLFGTGNAVQNAIDVSKGDSAQLSGAIIDSYNQLGTASIKFAFVISEQTRNEMKKSLAPGNTPISAQAFADIDLLGFALNKEGQDITTQLNAHFLSKDSAQSAKDTITGTITLMKGMLNVPELKDMLGKIQVTLADDSWVDIALNTTLSDIEKLNEALNKK